MKQELKESAVRKKEQQMLSVTNNMWFHSAVLLFSEFPAVLYIHEIMANNSADMTIKS